MIDKDFIAISNWYDKEYERIKQEAIANGTWLIGLYANHDLFMELREELKERLRIYRETKQVIMDDMIKDSNEENEC